MLVPMNKSHKRVVNFDDFEVREVSQLNFLTDGFHFVTKLKKGEEKLWNERETATTTA